MSYKRSLTYWFQESSANLNCFARRRWVMVVLLNKRCFQQQKNDQMHTYVKGGNKMTQQLFLISDVARQLNVAAHRIAYLFMSRKLPEPQLRLGNRRCFTCDDVRKVARALGIT